MTNIPTTSTLIRSTDEIEQDLKAGKISNSVARTLLTAINTKINAMKLEAEFSKIGANVEAVPLHAEDRKHVALRKVS